MNTRAMSELVCLTCGHELDPITHEAVNEVTTRTQTWINNDLPEAEETKEVLCQVCKRSKITIVIYTLPKIKDLITNNYYDIINYKNNYEIIFNDKDSYKVFQNKYYKEKNNAAL